MKCNICGRETVKIRILYNDGIRKEGCYTCVQSDAPDMSKVVMFINKKQTTAGHIRDIRARRVDRDGQMYYQKNTRYFIP